MGKREFARRSLVAVGASILVLVSAAPADASAVAVRSLTCVSSTGYSVVAAGTARGIVYHEILSNTTIQREWLKGGFLTLTYRKTNTHYTGTWNAGIIAQDGVSVSGAISSHSPYCGTYSS
jgi:hypothetical protein